jgi:hypothetical protein
VKKSLVIVCCLLLLSLSMLPGCEHRLVWSNSHFSEALTPAKTTLKFSALPILNREVRLTTTFYLRPEWEIIHGVTARIILPEGFELVSGDVELEGNFIGGNSYSIQADIKAIKTGEWMIGALADSTGAGPVASIGIFITVSENDARITDRG